MVKYGYLGLNVEGVSDTIELDRCEIQSKGTRGEVTIGKAEVKWTRFTRDTYMPWGPPDEIAYDLDITCKQCGGSTHLKDNETSCSKHDSTKDWSCGCGQCKVKVTFEFLSNTVGSFIANNAVKHTAMMERQWNSEIDVHKVHYHPRGAYCDA